jgi:hypothetical protein
MSGRELVTMRRLSYSDRHTGLQQLRRHTCTNCSSSWSLTSSSLISRSCRARYSDIQPRSAKPIGTAAQGGCLYQTNASNPALTLASNMGEAKRIN